MLVEQQQAQVVGGCGLVFWLVDLLDDLSRTEGGGADVGGVSLSEVIELLSQTTSLLFMSESTGNNYITSCYHTQTLARCKVLGVKGQCCTSSPTERVIFSAGAVPLTRVVCEGMSAMTPPMPHPLPSLPPSWLCVVAAASSRHVGEGV